MLKFHYKPKYTCGSRPFALILGATGDCGQEIAKAFNCLGYIFNFNFLKNLIF